MKNESGTGNVQDDLERLVIPENREAAGGCRSGRMPRKTFFLAKGDGVGISKGN